MLNVRLLPVAAAVALCACADPPPTAQPSGEAVTAPASRPPRTGNRTKSRRRAAKYLDKRVKRWLDAPPPVANVQCAMSCHTTFPAVLAQPYLPPASTPNIDRARERFEARLPSRAGPVVPFYGEGNDDKVRESHATEAVLTATALAQHDAATNGRIGPSAQEALDRMWAQQGDDGGWPWLDFGLEPWEHDDAFGVAMAALAAASAPAGPGQDAGLAKLRAHVEAHFDSASLHDRVALLWAAGSMPELLTEPQRDLVTRALDAAQHSDGSFALADLLPGVTATPPSGDGYATALATLALCTSNRNTSQVDAGLAWLEGNQNADGSWPGRSANGAGRRAERFMTDAATAYAVIALETCPSP